jgi:hypothetical protein
MNNELEQFVQNRRKEFDVLEPDPAVLEKLHMKLQKSSQKKHLVVPMRAIRWAAAASVILIAGSVFFWSSRKPEKAETILTRNTIPSEKPKQNDVPDQIAVVPEQDKTAPGNYQANPENNHFAMQKRSLFAQINNTELISQRIAGAMAANELKNIDKEIVDVLVNTMNNDPNINVRLTALESLGKFHREPYVKKQLVSSLKKQTDPAIQVQLIQLLTRMRESAIVTQLQKIIDNESSLKEVKDEAYSSLMKLNL